MLKIEFPGEKAREAWDPKKEEFFYIPEMKPATLLLEHSLLSLSKWESKYHKPFLVTKKHEKDGPVHDADEMLYYIECMTINNVDPDIYCRLTDEHIQQIGDYIADPMTATTITHRGTQASSGQRSSEIVTSELIYYWMTVHQIPFECQKWHLNRLLMLIEVCNVKNAPPKKMSKADILRQNHAINNARRAKYHTRG